MSSTVCVHIFHSFMSKRDSTKNNEHSALVGWHCKGKQNNINCQSQCAPCLANAHVQCIYPESLPYKKRQWTIKLSGLNHRQATSREMETIKRRNGNLFSFVDFMLQSSILLCVMCIRVRCRLNSVILFLICASTSNRLLRSPCTQRSSNVFILWGEIFWFDI